MHGQQNIKKKKKKKMKGGFVV